MDLGSATAAAAPGSALITSSIPARPSPSPAPTSANDDSSPSTSDPETSATPPPLPLAATVATAAAAVTAAAVTEAAAAAAEAAEVAAAAEAAAAAIAAALPQRTNLVALEDEEELDALVSALESRRQGAESLPRGSATATPELCVGHCCRVFWWDDSRWYDADVVSYNPGESCSMDTILADPRARVAHHAWFCSPSFHDACFSLWVHKW